MRVERGLEAAMRDGTVLRADAYLPDDDGPVPAVLSRTPYDRSFSMTAVAALDPELAVEAGFAVVIQDVRGQHGSDGDFNPFVNEATDGYDTVEWVAAQPWCNGDVGMAGRSYPGATQWRAALERAPSLRAICPVVSGSDYYDGWIYSGGAFELGFNLFWVQLMTDPKARGSIDEHYRHLPITEPPLLAHSPAGDFYSEWLAHPSYDDYWRERSVRGRYGDIEVPALIVGGWYDIFVAGTLENYTSMRAHAGTPEARAGARLLIGPWGHGTAFGPYPDHRLPGFGNDDRIDLGELQLRFFGEHLAGDRHGGEEPPVRIFVMGENRWRDEAEWPLARAETQRWFLHADGDAAGAGGWLSPTAPGDEPHEEYTYDPRDPAPTKGGPTSLPGRMMRPSAGPLDQAAIEERPDVLVFSSEPLGRPLEVTGPLALVLHVASSAPDTDFVAKLCDVDPDGVSRILQEGVLRMRYRNGFDAPELADPGTVLELRIDLAATSNVFMPGHRVRLDVTSSSFPRFDRNANSGLPIGADTEETLVCATQSVFHDSARPSHLLLPVVPR